jgi:hypothetical protein
MGHVFLVKGLIGYLVNLLNRSLRMNGGTGGGGVGGQKARET